MKKKYIGIITVLVVLISISVYKSNDDPKEISANEKEVEEKVFKKIYVEIKGAVAKPGIYEFEKETRLFEVIEVAGGLVEGANLDYINQTRVMEDQMLIIILTNDQIAAAKASKELGEIGNSEVITVDNSVKEVKGYDKCYCDSNVSGKISLNSATSEQLQTLPGIGESKANAIIEYRNVNGGFKSIEELKNVNGIGDATFNKLKDSISL